jgi:cobalt-zinc-cadmium efflux system outer membrane protein
VRASLAWHASLSEFLMKSHILMVMCLCLWGGVAPAQDKQHTPFVTLSQAVNSAWARAVVAREATGQLTKADADKSAAQRLWAKSPSLEYSQRDNRFQADTGLKETEVGVVWPVWQWGQRGAQNTLAASALTKADHNAQFVRLKLAAEVREAIWMTKDAEVEYGEAVLLAETLTRLARDVDRRVGAGDLARVDSLVAHGERLAALALQSEASQKLSAMLARWQNLTGLRTPLSTEAATEQPSALKSVIAHPELLLSIQSADEAKKKLELVEASNREAPELKVGMRQELAARTQPGQSTLIVGFRLPLGTSDRNRPLLAAALTDVEVSTTQEQRTHERIESEHELAKQALTFAQQQLQSAKERADLLNERTALIEKSFKAGETSLPDYLRAVSLSSQAQTAYLRQISKTYLATARFNQSLGVMP